MLGFEIGDIDAVIGPKTRAAIREVQKSQGLSTDGVPTASLVAPMKGPPRKRAWLGPTVKLPSNYVHRFFGNSRPISLMVLPPTAGSVLVVDAGSTLRNARRMFAAVEGKNGRSDSAIVTRTVASTCRQLSSRLVCSEPAVPFGHAASFHGLISET